MINAILAGSALMLLQAGAPAMIEASNTAVVVSDETRDVAFDAIAAGRSTEALQRIEQQLAEMPGDPALLINLAAAHLAHGDYQLAAEAYRRAAASSDRYLVELSDGSWMDSRLAARRGLRATEGRMLAAR